MNNNNTQSYRSRPRRCSICGHTDHTRWAHCRRDQRNQMYHISRRRHEQLNRRNERLVLREEEKIWSNLQLFKSNLETSIREKESIYEFIQDFKLFGTLTCVEKYAIELGSPTNCSYDEYFWRITAFIHHAFKENNIERIDQISNEFANAYMSQPEPMYFDYCAEVHRIYIAMIRNEVNASNESDDKLKQTRMQKLVVETEYSQLSGSDTYYFDCPICYENCGKLNSFETKCGHKYCEDCFTNYMMKLDLTCEPSCPLCRTNICVVNCYTEIIMCRYK